MENLVLSFQVVLPLFLNIALGYFLRCIGLIEEATQKSMNRLCFRVFLPIYLFSSVYSTNLTAVFDPGLIAFAVGGVVAVFLIMMLLIPRIEADNAKRGVMVQAVFRSNFVLFGLPVVTSLCGEDHIGPTSLLIGFVVPVFNVLAVVCLEYFRGGKPDVRKMLRGIASNPLIIASVLGIAMNLPLVVLGAGFQFGSIRGSTRQLALCIPLKLVVVPLVMLTLGTLLGYRGDTLVPILAIFGAPIAVSSYTMAEQMDGDGTLAASLVVLTTAFSILTMFLFIFALKQLGLV